MPETRSVTTNAIKPTSLGVFPDTIPSTTPDARKTSLLNSTAIRCNCGHGRRFRDSVAIAVLPRVQRVIDRTRPPHSEPTPIVGSVLCYRFVVVLKGQLSDKPLLAIEVNVHIDDFKVQSLLRCANFLLLRANSHFQVSRRQPPMEAGTVAFDEAEPLMSTVAVLTLTA